MRAPRGTAAAHRHRLRPRPAQHQRTAGHREADRGLEADRRDLLAQGLAENRRCATVWRARNRRPTTTRHEQRSVGPAQGRRAIPGRRRPRRRGVLSRGHDEGLRVREICRGASEKKDELQGLPTVVRRNGSDLTGVPYSKAYAELPAGGCQTSRSGSADDERLAENI